MRQDGFKISKISCLMLAYISMATGCMTIEGNPEREVAPVVSSVPATVPVEESPAVPVSVPAPKSVPISKPAPTHEPAPVLVPIEASISIVTEEYPREVRMIELLKIESAPLDEEGAGYYMDVQFANLQQKLNANVGVLSRYEDKISIFLPENDAFEKTGIQLSLAAEEALAVIAGVLNEYDKTLIVIEGYTREEGDEEYRQLLSEERSLAVGTYLSEHEVMFQRLLIIRFGDDLGIRQLENGGIELVLEPISEESSE